MRMKVQIDGIDELTEKLRKSGIAPSRVLSEAAQAGAEVIRADAARRAPGPNVIIEETGEKFTGRKARVTFGIGADKKHFYYNYFERGTAEHGPAKKGRIYMKWFENGKAVYARRVRGVGSRPWLRPAFDSQREPAKHATGEVFKRAVEAIAR